MKESVILSGISLLGAIFLVWMVLPFFNQLVDKNLALQLFKPAHLLGLLSVVTLCALLSGSYPAFYLSSFNPINTLSKTKIKHMITENRNTGCGSTVHTTVWPSSHMRFQMHAFQ
jgi:beta-lactamase regulating signal transducer with metallopeptidase domain